MTRDEILEFAKDVWGRDKLSKGRDNHFDFYVELVRAAMAKEREACARVCDEFSDPAAKGYLRNVAVKIKAAIRARGEVETKTPDYLEKCPNCGGPADNGFDRSWPDPNPYYCTKCMETGEY